MIKTEEKNLVSTQSSNFNNYRKEVLEVLEHLKKIKTKKLKEKKTTKVSPGLQVCPKCADKERTLRVHFGRSLSSSTSLSSN